MIELRVLTPDDWRDWRALRLAALAEAPHAFRTRLADWQGDGDREARWRGRLETPGSLHVVAVLDGDEVGLAGGMPPDVAWSAGLPPAGDAAWLVSMWVAPEGRGWGVGDALVEGVEEWARASGADALRLTVVEGNDAAAALYRRHGFVPTGEELDPMPDGRREVELTKRL